MTCSVLSRSCSSVCCYSCGEQRVDMMYMSTAPCWDASVCVCRSTLDLALQRFLWCFCLFDLLLYFHFLCWNKSAVNVLKTFCASLGHRILSHSTSSGSLPKISSRPGKLLFVVLFVFLSVPSGRRNFPKVLEKSAEEAGRKQVNDLHREKSQLGVKCFLS